MLASDKTRRLIRTVLNIALSTAIVLGILVPTIVDAFGPVLPSAWGAWLAATGATVIAVAAAVQKVLTSDLVERFLLRRAPSLAASVLTVDGAYALTDDESLALTQLHAALDEGDPSRTALARVLSQPARG